MSTVRQIVADQIKADNPEFIVKGFPTTALDRIPAGKTSVQVYRDRLEPASNGTSLSHSLKIIVMVAKQGTEQAETDLEEALDLVLLSLERSRTVIYSSVDRDVVDDMHLYVISAAASTTNHYKNLVREEQKAVTP